MGTSNITLNGSVGAAQVSELHAAALEAVQSGETVTFDCKNATDIDASVLQVMLATHAATEERGTHTELADASESLIKLVQDHGGSQLVMRAATSTDTQQAGTQAAEEQKEETPQEVQEQQDAAQVVEEQEAEQQDASASSAEPE